MDPAIAKKEEELPEGHIRLPCWGEHGPVVAPYSQYALWKKWDRVRDWLEQNKLYVAHAVLALQPPRFTRMLPTAAVALNKYGGIEFLFNPDFFMSLGIEEAAFIAAHEAMHVTSGHIYTKMPNPMLFNITADIIVNSWLGTQAKFKIGKHLKEMLWDSSKINMDANRLLQHASAEDLYHIFEQNEELVKRLTQQYILIAISGDLRDESDEGQGNGEIKIPGNAKSTGGSTLDDHGTWGPITKEAVKDIVRQVKERFPGGPDGNGWSHGDFGNTGMYREFEPVEQYFDWEGEIKRFMGSIIHRIETYERPNRRLSSAIPKVVLPYVREQTDYHIYVYADVSGSIGDETLSRFMAVLKKAPPSIKLMTFSFDTAVYEWNYPIEQNPPAVTGGTDFQCVVDHAEAVRMKKPDGIIVLTDGICSEPDVKRPAWWLWVSTQALLTPKSGKWIKMPEFGGHRVR